MTSSSSRTYPRTVACEGSDVELRLMTPADGDAVLAFARTLPEHDLLFLPRDISERKVVAAWVLETARGSITSVLALHQGAIAGCATLVRDELSWSRHVGELRVVVAPDMRGKGLGQQLTREGFALALGLGLEKLVANMTVDQRGAIAVFQAMGFRPEALLMNHVKDRAGKTHDIVILGHDVARFQSQMQAYGVTEAL